MKIGVLITTFNRPEYLRRCLESVKRSDLSRITSIMIVDDCSSDHDTINLINEFKKDCFKEQITNVTVYPKLENKSIKDSLLTGYDFFFENGYDFVINLDGDALVRNDWIDRIMDLKERQSNMMVSGFNCNTLNRDGSVRHQHFWKEPGAIYRKSVGGINLCINKEQYHKWVRPALIKTLSEGGNWDHHSCLNSNEESMPVAVVVPSVIQHIGINSSMGHGAGDEPADTTEDFKFFSLKNVTLIGVDDDVKKIIKAADMSCIDIEFGAVKILSSTHTTDSRHIKIRHLGSSQEYSQFVLKELVQFINTPHFLLIQGDGFVVNGSAFQMEWLNYDYIGAPWFFHNDNKQVGNGGCSLRSTKLHRILQDDEQIVLTNDHQIKNFAEDHNICRIYYDYLIQHYQIKFAPVEVAERFSIEAWGQQPPNNKYSGQFAFHGFGVDFNEANLPYIPYRFPNPQRIIF